MRAVFFSSLILLVLCLHFAGSIASDVDAKRLDFVIVGAGPAGIQWGLLLEAAGVDSYVIVERNTQAGSFFEQYPRSRKLISANRAHLGRSKSADFGLRHDWHSLLEAPSFARGRYSSLWNPHASELVSYLQEISTGLRVQYNTSVLSTKYSEDSKLHTVFTEQGAVFLAKYLIIATGMRMRDVPPCLEQVTRDRGMPFYTYETLPDAMTNATNGKGAEQADWCRGRPVTVFGGGNAAFELTDILAPCSSSVRLVYRHKPRFSYLTHYVGDVRITNAGILDRYQLKSLDELTAMDVRGVAPQSSYLRAKFRELGQEPWQPELDGGPFDECAAYPKILLRSDEEVVVYAGGFTGSRPGIAHVKDGHRFPEVGSFWKDRRDAGRYYSGNLMHGADYRQSAGGFIHGFRYSIRAQFRHIMRKHTGVPWPSQHFATEDEALGAAVERVQNASGLYQMQDFLADVIVSHPNGSATYYYELPEKWMYVEIPELRKGKGLLIKLAFSNREAWTHELNFNDSRVGRVPGLFLHPIITPILRGATLDPCHATEDPTGEWAEGFMVRDLEYNLILCAMKLEAEAEMREGDEIEFERRALAKLQTFSPEPDGFVFFQPPNPAVDR